MHIHELLFSRLITATAFRHFSDSAMIGSQSLPPSVRREVKGLSVVCVLVVVCCRSYDIFSDILISWKKFKINKAQILTLVLSNVSI